VGEFVPHPTGLAGIPFAYAHALLEFRGSHSVCATLVTIMLEALIGVYVGGGLVKGARKFLESDGSMLKRMAKTAGSAAMWPYSVGKEVYARIRS
jgi:hypothetical protein